MQYLGGKAKIAWQIVAEIEKRRQPDQLYFEPFVGGANVIDKVKGRRVGIDSNKYLIAMWKAVQEGWIPPAIVSEETYKKLQNNKDNYPAHIVGFVGFASSFGGKWWGGYARGKPGRNYTKGSIEVVKRQNALMKDVKFHHLDALTIKKFPEGSLIYCDPPYANTTGYKDKFDSERFWKWAEFHAKRNTVLISSEVAPANWESILDIERSSEIGSVRRRIERVFMLKGKG